MSRARRESSVLVDADWIADHLGAPGVRFVEVDVSPAAYEQGHIPGAVLWDAYADLRDSSYQPVERAELERLLSLAGVAENTTLVFYGYGAALGFWLMKAHGHEDVRMLPGSREQWLDAGGTWSREAPEVEPSPYRLPEPSADLLATRQEIQAAIDDPGQVLLDTRSELEFSGERFWPSGASEDVGRAGHVPGAISVPIDRVVLEGGAFRDPVELRSAFEESGVSAEEAVIVYCTIGNRASQGWFALSHLLGFPHVRVYYGSWVEWGRRAETPIECRAGDRPSS